MKSIVSLTSVILLFSSFLFSSCGTAKYSADFKKQKKHLDTLTIASPFVEIYAISKNNKYLDTDLTTNNLKIIEETAFELLDSKYSLKKTILMPPNNEELNSLITKLESSSKLLNDISTKNLNSYNENGISSRFILLLIYNGKINPNYGPNHNLKVGMATGLLVINPSAKPHSDLRLLVIDKEREEVVYYDKFRSSNYEPRLTSQVEQMTKTILKSIYYK